MRATKAIAEDLSSNNLSSELIDEKVFESYLDTDGVPYPDIMIRTGGEVRLSNFLLWQLAYTELFFVDKYWPEFSVEDLDAVLASYKNRDRRFGGI